MTTNKTQPTERPIDDYLKDIPEKKQADALKLIEIMSSLTQAPAIVWGSSIVGFGQYTYRYSTGRTGDWFYCGFAIRKRAISLYVSCDLNGLNFDWDQLGKHRRSVGCVYINTLSDVNEVALRELLQCGIDQADDSH
ncbi:MAG: DUF1801 domain-containing protein [Flavobacteriaceae bacterium]